MTRVGLISDTHIPRDIPFLRDEIITAFDGVDFILHAGDIYEVSVLDRLEQIAPVRGAFGSHYFDPQSDPRVQKAQIITIAEARIGLVHAFEYEFLIHHGQSLEQCINRIFGGCVDIVVHGDTHIPEVKELDGVLLINPGSATIPLGIPHKPGTVAILDLNGKERHGEIVQLSWPLS
ncbi:MAG: YfcE family phosphodiesterase [Chloroflexi bacterium]|nr:YfcE family phosphodiesterase [Chloroflexota bacterium]